MIGLKISDGSRPILQLNFSAYPSSFMNKIPSKKYSVTAENLDSAGKIDRLDLL